MARRHMRCLLVNRPLYLLFCPPFQIFGRAGRPQFDKFGLATIITSQDKLAHYVRLITNQVPIESKLLNNLNDHLNAEVCDVHLYTVCG